MFHLFGKITVLIFDRLRNKTITYCAFLPRWWRVRFIRSSILNCDAIAIELKIIISVFFFKQKKSLVFWWDWRHTWRKLMPSFLFFYLILHSHVHLQSWSLFLRIHFLNILLDYCVISSRTWIVLRIQPIFSLSFVEHQRLALFFQTTIVPSKEIAWLWLLQWVGNLGVPTNVMCFHWGHPCCIWSRTRIKCYEAIFASSRLLTNTDNIKGRFSIPINQSW